MVKKMIKAEYSAIHGAMSKELYSILCTLDVGSTMDKCVVPESEIVIRDDYAELSFENDVMDKLIIEKDVIIGRLELDNVIINKGLIIRGTVSEIVISNSVINSVKGTLLYVGVYDSEIVIDVRSKILTLDMIQCVFCITVKEVVKEMSIRNSMGFLYFTKEGRGRINFRSCQSVLYGFCNFAGRAFTDSSNLVNTTMVTNDITVDTEGDVVHVGTVIEKLKADCRCPKCGRPKLLDTLCQNFRCTY